VDVTLEERPPVLIVARERGDVEHGHAACGQSAGLIHGIEDAREVIERMVGEPHRILSGFGR
jgi:hypothetical protein